MNSKKNTKIALISGHNAVSQGAWWRGQVSEHLFANEIIPEIMSQASGIAGIELKHFKREKNTGYCAEMRELHGRVDRWGANISIECHFNAGGKTAKGHEVLYYRSSKGGRIIATAMQKSFNKHLFNKDRGRKPVGTGERGSYGLKIGKARAILVEPFFKKELADFVVGGEYRDALIDSYIEFFRQIVALDSNTRELSPERREITRVRTAELTDAEIAFALELLA